MPWTLQRYILGEMGRTFVLTAVALTGVLGMGGGLMHLVRLGEISGGQLLRLMLLTLPVATALTLPIAALFAAAATYGRLSANNEFVACRSSGINIHVLLLPSVLLSLVCTLVTFGLTNFIIPQMARNLETFLGQDLGDMIQRQLQRPQGWALGPYRVYSDYAPTVPGDPSLVVVRGVAFLRMENETWEIAGTAREAQLRFVRRNGRTYLEGHLLGLRGFDRRKGQAIDNEQLPFGPVPIPGPDLVKLKFLDLHQLLHYWQAPWEWREAQEALDDLRQALGRQRYYDDVERQWQDAGEVRLTGTNVTYGLRAPAAERRSETNALVLLDVDVEEQRPLLTMQYRAARAVFEVVAAERETGRWALRVELQDVQERAADGTSSPGLERKVLGPLAVGGRVRRVLGRHRSRSVARHGTGRCPPRRCSKPGRPPTTCTTKPPARSWPRCTNDWRSAVVPCCWWCSGRRWALSTAGRIC